MANSIIYHRYKTWTSNYVSTGKKIRIIDPKFLSDDFFPRHHRTHKHLDGARAFSAAKLDDARRERATK